MPEKQETELLEMQVYRANVFPITESLFLAKKKLLQISKQRKQLPPREMVCVCRFPSPGLLRLREVRVTTTRGGEWEGAK
jgi:hypothetical protein